MKEFKKNTLMIHYSRTDIVLFKHKIGLPLGPKNDIKIPKWIITNKDYSKACVGGIFATDGCLIFQKKYRKYPYYPKLKITSKSGKLIKQIHNILNEYSIKSSIICEKIRLPRRPNHIWNTYCYGVNNLRKFIEIIGFINPKHQKKFDNWRRGDLNPQPLDNPV